MSAQNKKRFFKDANSLCLFSFFVLANYFAAVGIFYANRALRSRLAGDSAAADADDRRARAWALWGLIPSTVINVAIIAVFVWWLYTTLIPLFDRLLKVNF